MPHACVRRIPRAFFPERSFSLLVELTRPSPCVYFSPLILVWERLVLFFFQANGLQDVDSMWRLLMVEDEAACITCPVRPIYPFESFLAAAQFLECENSRSSVCAMSL